ncbi:hypothetical protein FOA52_011235 [Chlamydomonas sp. UWO 241]|nr:hypothetical protein FOA52_011235 [Chlamydomonas sp. UWO 241]
MALNLRKKQTDVVVRILSLSSSQLASSSKDPASLYKVLVLDRFTKNVIAPLLRVSDLRKQGVTLHLLIEADRQPIADVPAIYLVQPDAANVERIGADAAAGLYDVMHLNFTSTLPIRLMESLAASAVKAGAVNRVGKLFDQYLSFIALEPSLFSLGLPDSYVHLNDPSAADHMIEAAIQSIVDGLFSVCVTLGVVPVIRCPRGGAAEAVAGMLDGKLRDALRARNNLFSEGMMGMSASLARPLLVLFDRNFDLSGALQQPWTYKPLVQDTLGMQLNRVNVAGEAGPSGAAGASRSYDVDERDFFWEACGSHEFPRVAEEVEGQLRAYREKVDEINRKTNAGPQEGVAYDHEELMARNTQSLMSAVSSLPELQERKKTLDKHTNLATSLLGAIKGRSLDQYHHLAEDLLLGKGDRAAVAKLIQGPKGSAGDKLRLALLWLLAYDGMPSDAELGEMEQALLASGADIAALSYVRTLKRNNLTGAKGGPGAGGAPQAADGSLLSSQAYVLDWADKTFGQGLSTVTKGMRSMMSGARTAPMAASLEALMEGRPGSEHESYAVLDPKQPPGRATLDAARGPFKDAVVFVIGGGNYLEREQLVAWGAKAQPPRQLLYGATELLSGQEFVRQLGTLARRSNPLTSALAQ